MDRDPAVWPDLPYPAWRGTAATLQLWTQVVGKIRLSLTPWLNHSWQVALYVTARGLGTSPIPFGNEILEIELDFISHRLLARTSQGAERTLALEPQSVADFYSRVVELLSAVGVSVAINEMPCEVPDPIRFSQDHTHAAYDAAAAHRFWRALVQIDRVFRLFRSGFLGKVSPVHFFWGRFHLAVTRFSGRRRCIPVACPACRTRSCARPIRTRSAAPASGQATKLSRCPPSTPMPIPNRRASVMDRYQQTP